jgi:Caenorhabditis protein of unknown function, DUF268
MSTAGQVLKRTAARVAPRLAAFVRERKALRAQLRDVGRELAELRAAQAKHAHEIGVRDTHLRAFKYRYARFQWQTKALQRELFGPPEPTPDPPRQIPADLLSRFTMDGKVEIEEGYVNATYPANHPLIYTDQEIDSYLQIISENLKRPESERAEHWYIYGTLDQWVCDAIAKYPIRGLSVVNMGSLTPWYESMFILFGGKPVTIDYNLIIVKSDRMSFMTIDEWERQRPVFDAGFSISSFEHDGLGMYGDPLDPDGDLKAMRKMTERIKPGGLLFLAVPTGRDKILFNNARIYGRHRLPMLMAGWEWIDSFGYSKSDLDGNGSAQPLYVLRNRRA